jgi:hypothetical protein
VTSTTETATPATPTAEEGAAAAAKAEKEKAKSSWTKGRPLVMQYIRAQDKRGAACGR